MSSIAEIYCREAPALQGRAACFRHTIEGQMFVCLSVCLSVCLFVCPHKWNIYSDFVKTFMGMMCKKYGLPPILFFSIWDFFLENQDFIPKKFFYPQIFFFRFLIFFSKIGILSQKIFFTPRFFFSIFDFFSKIGNFSKKIFWSGISS